MVMGNFGEDSKTAYFRPKNAIPMFLSYSEQPLSRKMRLNLSDKEFWETLSNDSLSSEEHDFVVSERFGATLEIEDFIMDLRNFGIHSTTTDSRAEK